MPSPGDKFFVFFCFCFLVVNDGDCAALVQGSQGLTLTFSGRSRFGSWDLKFRSKQVHV